MTSDLSSTGTYRVFVRDLRVQCEIGVYEHERGRLQPLRISVDLDVEERPLQDQLRLVFNYEKVVEAVRAAVATGHTGLLETLAERIAAPCLEDRRVRIARVRIEKLDVFPDADCAGIEITRRQSQP